MAGVVKSIPEDKLEEFAVLIRARNAKFEVILRLGVETGLRVSDMLKLRVRQFKRHLSVYEGKTGKKKECQLSDELLALGIEYIKAHRLAPADALFYSARHRKFKAVSRIRVYQVFRATAKELGLTNIGPHSTRKTYAKRVLKETGSIKAVQHALNHKYLDTTLHYLFDLDQMAAGVQTKERIADEGH